MFAFAVRPLLVAALLTGLLSGASAHGAEDPATAVQAVLDSRVAAVAAKDKAAFMATVDPQAGATFRASQALSFDGISTVALADYALRVRLDDSGDLAAGIDLAKQHDADRAYAPETRQSFRFAGYDDRDAIDSLWFTYVERKGHWYVASDSDFDALGLQNGREIWDFGPVSTQQTSHFLLLAPAADAGRAQALGGIAEDAMSTFSARWTAPWSKHVPIIIPANNEQATALLRTPVDLSKFVAFVTYTPIRDGETWSTTAPRIFAQDGNLAQQSRATQVNNLVHELTHAAEVTTTGPFSPTWVHEGLAEWIRLGRPTTGTRPSGAGDTLPSTIDFTTGAQATISLAYAEAASAMTYAAKTFGPDAPLKITEAVGSQRVAAGTPSYNIDQALRAAIGESLGDFEAGWAKQP